MNARMATDGYDASDRPSEGAPYFVVAAYSEPADAYWTPTAKIQAEIRISSVASLGLRAGEKAGERASSGLNVRVCLS